MCDILALSLYSCYSLALPVCALWQLVCLRVSGLRFAPVLRGIKRHFYTIRTSVFVYEPLYVLSVKWTSTPCENQCVWIWGNDCVCVCLSMCVCERKRNRQPVFSRAGSETAGRDNNRSCYILVVSLISAWGRGLALALALALDLDLALALALAQVLDLDPTLLLVLVLVLVLALTLVLALALALALSLALALAPGSGPCWHMAALSSTTKKSNEWHFLGNWNCNLNQSNYRINDFVLFSVSCLLVKQ